MEEIPEWRDERLGEKRTGNGMEGADGEDKKGTTSHRMRFACWME